MILSEKKHGHALIIKQSWGQCTQHIIMNEGVERTAVNSSPKVNVHNHEEI